MTTFTAYDAVGIKEDVSDIITNISPTKTPFQSDIGNEKVWNKIYEWQEDELRAAASNAAVEGADASYITVVPTTLRTNYTQIFVEAVQVSGSMDAVSTYGRARESAYQIAKSAAAVKRDYEYACVGSQQVGASGADGSARSFLGAQYMISLGNAATGSHGMGASGANVYYGGTGGYLSEANLLNSLQFAFEVGAEPNVVYVTPANSLLVAAFAKASGRFRTIEDNRGGDTKAMVNAVDLYVSPFGEVRIKLDRFLHAGDTIVSDTDMWAKMTLRPWTREPLAKTGDSLKQMIVGEFGLKLKNFLAAGLIVDNASSGL